MEDREAGLVATKSVLKNFLGDLPLTAEIDWMLRQKNRARKDHFNLDRLGKSLPAARAVVESIAKYAKPGKNVLFFATLHYWVEQSAYLGLVLAGIRHKDTLFTLCHSELRKRKDKFSPPLPPRHT